MIKNKCLKNIRYKILCKTYYEILRRVNTERPELISGELDNILIIAPHPDDDVIGCGGLLAKNRNNRIKVIFVTDGRYGSEEINEKDLPDVRRNEAEQALNYLGIRDIEFLNVEDSKSTEKVIEVSEMLKDISRWDNIFIPNILDNHNDHKAVAFAVYGALSKVNNVKSIIWMYEVWTPQIPNVLIDITEVAEDKKTAINKHKSQIKCFDYSNKILGLNSYRAISVPADKNVQYCEAYYRCSFDKFKHLIKV